MTSLNVKMDLIKLDMVVKDIHHIWSQVPSRYAHPKTMLAQSRAYVRSDVKKALNYANSARKLFQAESILATRFNSVSEDIDRAGEPSKTLRNHYLAQIVSGDYEGAEETLDKLISSVEKSEGFGTHLSVEMTSSDDNGCTLSFVNSGDYTILITSLSVSKGPEIAKTDPKPTFSVQPKGTRTVSVPLAAPFTVAADYSECGESHSIRTNM